MWGKSSSVIIGSIFIFTDCSNTELFKQVFEKINPSSQKHKYCSRKMMWVHHENCINRQSECIHFNFSLKLEQETTSSSIMFLDNYIIYITITYQYIHDIHKMINIASVISLFHTEKWHYCCSDGWPILRHWLFTQSEASQP